MIRMQISEFAPSRKAVFNPTLFIEKLNRLITEDPLEEKFALNFVLLDPLKDLVTYISCGFDALLHLSQEQSKPRKLSSENDLLGTSATAEFAETTDNWNAGDILILHSLALPQESKPQEKEQFDQAMSEAIAENFLFSAQRQSESILKRVSSAPVFSSISYSRALVSIQRII
jgi:serine phosphatase RsbU (regulator of sigma subunit)